MNFDETLLLQTYRSVRYKYLFHILFNYTLIMIVRFALRMTLRWWLRFVILFIEATSLDGPIVYVMSMQTYMYLLSTNVTGKIWNSPKV